MSGRAGTPGATDGTNSELPRPWGRTGGRKHSAKTSDWRGGGPFSPRGRCGLRLRLEAMHRVLGRWGAGRWAPPVRTPRPLLSLPQRARGPRWSWCLTQRSAGRGRAPPHCSTETRAPSPCLGPGAGTRGPFLVSGWTRSYSVLRRPPKPHPEPIHLSDPVGSGLGSPFLCPPLLCLSCSLSSLSALFYLSLFSLSRRLFSCPPMFCPVSVSPGSPPPTTHSPGQVPLEGPDSPYSFLFPQVNPHMNKVQNKVLLPTGARTPAAAELNFFLCPRALY